MNIKYKYLIIVYCARIRVSLYELGTEVYFYTN